MIENSASGMAHEQLEHSIVGSLMQMIDYNVAEVKQILAAIERAIWLGGDLVLRNTRTDRRRLICETKDWLHRRKGKHMAMMRLATSTSTSLRSGSHLSRRDSRNLVRDAMPTVISAATRDEAGRM